MACRCLHDRRMVTTLPIRLWTAGLFLILVAAPVSPVAAQSERASAPKYEFRGAWIATVLRLDWPRTTATSHQKQELVAILDRLHESGINAAFFQVRPEADAMYLSTIEPWSFWLTGRQGEAPEPFYDPLAFAVTEAHRRGIELHAWFNPYRADRGSSYSKSSNHVTAAHPEWILTFDRRKILNPGLPEVRNHVARVIADVLRRYDVDGVVFDDYFYPYPPNRISDEDRETFLTYGGDFADIGDWRRNNVDLLINQVRDTVLTVKPDATFGVAPFGIWKNGVPEGIFGLDAYNVIYADAVHWLNQQWIDYLVPLLSWGFGGRQDYGTLAPWWAEHAARNRRHVYTGHGLYRSDPNTFDGTLHEPDEIPRQVRFNRDHPDIQGGVYFRARNLTQLDSQGFSDTLKTDLYRYPALPPIMNWRSLEKPEAPEELAYTWTGDDEVTLHWSANAIGGAKSYAVYRVRGDAVTDLSGIMEDPVHLLSITSETETTDRPGIADEPTQYFVTAVSANSVESKPSNVVSVEGRATPVEQPAAHGPAIDLEQNYPNPFQNQTRIRFTLDRPAIVSMRVYNVLGQVVATLLEEDRVVRAGNVTWDGTKDDGSSAAAGTYFYTLDAGSMRLTRAMVMIR